ncbi:PREDICTED: uncharacterized protein LOC107345842 [Acropora digitifera]|uniref:uncharacterized protein LOC107345842 n=1 Tax=Acropora digitifera TaxID=70779 RepID=UPI00077ADBD8|nr:PREDICTED: uncharacterized protein LOC107345842 [Acropora digitifera]
MAFSLGIALLELLLIVVVKATKWKYNEYTDEFEAGKLTCFTCHTFGLFPHCGSRIKDYGTKNKCKPCLLRIIYCTRKDINSCDCFKPRTVCSIGPKEEFPCYLESDISEFKPCSACCNNDGGMRVEQYGEQKMPKNVEYSYTNRGGNACGHRGSEERKSVSLLVLAVVVAVGIIVALVTIVLAVLYGRQRFSRLNGSDHLLVSPQGKDYYEETFEGQSNQPEKLMSFKNSGDTSIQIRVEWLLLCDGFFLVVAICRNAMDAIFLRIFLALLTCKGPISIWTPSSSFKESSTLSQ